MMIDLSKIAALSFDLDDTLYENVMVIRKLRHTVAMVKQLRIFR